MSFLAEIARVNGPYQKSMAHARRVIAMGLILKKLPTKTTRSMPSARAQSRAMDPMLLVIVTSVARAKSARSAAALLSARFICPKLLATVPPDRPKRV